MAPLPAAILSLCQVENSTLARQLYGAQVLKFLPQTDQHQTEAENNERFGPDVTGRLKIDGGEFAPPRSPVTTNIQQSRISRR